MHCPTKFHFYVVRFNGMFACVLTFVLLPWNDCFIPQYLHRFTVEETLNLMSQLHNLLLWIFGRLHFTAIFSFYLFPFLKTFLNQQLINAFLLHLTRHTTPRWLASDLFCCSENCLACSLCPLLSFFYLCPSLYHLVLSSSFAASCSSKESDSEQDPDEEVTAILHFN